MSNPTIEYIYSKKKKSFKKVARWDHAVILISFLYICFTSQKKLKLSNLLPTPASGYCPFCTEYRVPLERNNICLLPGACSNSHCFYSSFKFISSTKKKSHQPTPFGIMRENGFNG